MYIVYKITNLKNEKIYIGQTKNFKRRMSQHFYEVSSKNSLLKEAIKEFGKENFKIEILEETYFKFQAYYKEEFFINFYQSFNPEKGYNIKFGGNNYKQPDSIKKKISESQIGEKNHMFGKKGSLNKTSKRIIELKTNKIYESINLAAQELNLNFSHIAAVCRGSRNSTGGFIFRFIDENNQIIENERSIINRARRIKCNETNKIYNSFKEIQEDLNKNIDSGNIIKNIKGKNKTSYGYTWSYVD